MGKTRSSLCNVYGHVCTLDEGVLQVIELSRYIYYGQTLICTFISGHQRKKMFVSIRATVIGVHQMV